jgi:1,4-dihydroxy-2-naphthoate octaprenyltransferase
VAAGGFFAWSWRSDPLLLWPYLGAWAAFTLYSLPPFRLKERGIAGVFADAAGALLFPALVAVALVYRDGGSEPALLWLAAVALWALAYGLRGILWHQLLDAEADRAAGTATFVLRTPRTRVLQISHYLIFPTELTALSLLLWQVPSWLPAVALIFYMVAARHKLRVFRMTAVIVDPKPRYMIVLNDYYDVFLPIALLLACALRWPIAGLALAVHLVLFPRRAREVARELWKLRPF